MPGQEGGHCYRGENKLLVFLRRQERNGLRAVIMPLLEGCVGDGGKEQCCKVLCSALGMCSGIVVVNGIIPIAREGHSAVP